MREFSCCSCKQQFSPEITLERQPDSILMRIHFMRGLTPNPEVLKNIRGAQEGEKASKKIYLEHLPPRLIILSVKIGYDNMM